jgi:hypothetical protein
MKLKLILTTAIAAAGVGGLLADQAAALPSACSQSGPTVTCTYTSGSNPFTVPAGVFSIHVVAVGGTGGAGDLFGSPESGRGAAVSGDLPVKARSTLYAVVGANGSRSEGGGGGGTSSDVRTSQNDLATRLLVAAGGGGGGGLGGVALIGTPIHSFTPGALGGAGGGNDGFGGAAGGGGGGSTSGGAGGAGITGCLTTPLFPICGTGQSGSAGGSGFGGDGGAGALFDQGGLFIAGGRGGGGGGGWFGGGGGGGGGLAPNGGGGGGGGSNLVPPGGSQTVDTVGIPLIKIAYIHGHP